MDVDIDDLLLIRNEQSCIVMYQSACFCLGLTWVVGVLTPPARLLEVTHHCTPMLVERTSRLWLQEVRSYLKQSMLNSRTMLKVSDSGVIAGTAFVIGRYHFHRGKWFCPKQFCIGFFVRHDEYSNIITKTLSSSQSLRQSISVMQRRNGPTRQRLLFLQLHLSW